MNWVFDLEAFSEGWGSFPEFECQQSYQDFDFLLLYKATALLK